MKLLSIGNDAKTIKGEKLGYRTAILYLQPTLQLCPWSSAGCRAGCLNTAGRGQMSVVQQARKAKTEYYTQHTLAFCDQLVEEIIQFAKSCKRAGMMPAVRLNGTSDIDFKQVRNDVLAEYCSSSANPWVTFYDYTKSVERALQLCNVTFSRTEYTPARTIKYLASRGINTAVVFRNELPKMWNGIPVINGDEHDCRFLDPRGVIVGLKAKGCAKHDTTGFVVDVEEDVTDE